MAEFEPEFFSADAPDSQIGPVDVDRIVLRTGETAVGDAHLAAAARYLDAVGKRRADSSASRFRCMDMVVDVQILAQLGDDAQSRSEPEPQMIQFDVFAAMQKYAVFVPDRIAELPHAADFDIRGDGIAESESAGYGFRTRDRFRAGVKRRPFVAAAVDGGTLHDPFFRRFRLPVGIQEVNFPVFEHGPAVRVQFELRFIAATVRAAHFRHPRMEPVNGEIAQNDIAAIQQRDAAHIPVEDKFRPVSVDGQIGDPVQQQADMFTGDAAVISQRIADGLTAYSRLVFMKEIPSRLQRDDRRSAICLDPLQ